MLYIIFISPLSHLSTKSLASIQKLDCNLFKGNVKVKLKIKVHD